MRGIKKIHLWFILTLLNFSERRFQNRSQTIQWKMVLDHRLPLQMIRQYVLISTQTGCYHAIINHCLQNNDNCETCGGVGEFLCCEGCPKAFHFVCLEPPMDAKDVANIKGKWFCNECKAKRVSKLCSQGGTELTNMKLITIA